MKCECEQFKMKSELCIFFLTCFAVFVTCLGDTSFDIASVLENIPEEERVGFIKHQMAVGYNLTKSGSVNIRDMRTKLSLQIYEYMINNHKVTDEDILKMLREIICFDDGTCVDIGDVGIHPFHSNEKLC